MDQESERDSERFVQMYEKQEVQFLEDSLAKKWMHSFLAWYFYEKIWFFNTLLPVSGVFLGVCVRLVYLGICCAYTNQLGIKCSKIFSPAWMVTHYFLYFIVFLVSYIYDKKIIRIEKKMLQKLLEEVAEMDFEGDPVAWPKIALSVDRFFDHIGRHYSLFYSGEQCRRFFVKEVVKPVKSRSFEIKTFHKLEPYTDYCQNFSNKLLVRRAVANYYKSVENFGELSPMDRNIGCSYCRFFDIFEKFGYITKNLPAYSMLSECALALIMILALCVFLIFLAIFSLFERLVSPS